LYNSLETLVGRFEAFTRGLAKLNMEIRDSVGDPKQGATNRTDDVKTVQGLLNMHLIEDRRSDRWLEVNGRIDSRALRVIDEFQRRHGLPRNGLIEPRDATAQALSRYGGPRSMHASRSLIESLESIEGFGPRPYNDAPDHPADSNATIGYGHELHSGPVTEADIERWGTISRGEAEQMLRHDLSNFEDEVNRDVRAPLNQNQFDALVDLAFNIGRHGFERSTVLQALNIGDYEGAAKRFTEYDHVHRGKHFVVSSGLLERRRWEEELFSRR
jgi:lysozyme